MNGRCSTSSLAKASRDGFQPPHGSKMLPLRLRRVDDDQREAVMALAADSLNGGGSDGLLGGQLLQKSPHTTHIGVRISGVQNRSLADDIVHDDHAAGTRELQ